MYTGNRLMGVTWIVLISTLSSGLMRASWNKLNIEAHERFRILSSWNAQEDSHVYRPQAHGVTLIALSSRLLGAAWNI